uniref:Uncharacterized protein n=1 Tax=Rhizophora mucronata TaxID=61149 RepID=A0A2P2PX53_RHIMU
MAKNFQLSSQAYSNFFRVT